MDNQQTFTTINQSDMDVSCDNLSFTNKQGYCIILCATIVLVALITAVYKIIETIILKGKCSCTTPQKVRELEKKMSDMEYSYKTYSKQYHKKLDSILGVLENNDTK